MSAPSVYAVMKVMLEVPVRNSSGLETFEQMHKAAKSEAEGLLRNSLPTHVRIVGQVEFSHAVVKELP